MKYIDTEKLIAEIERLQKRAKHYEEISLTDGERSYWSGEDGALELLTTFITSLQQEQPKSQLVKVRCVFPFDETWEKNKIYTCKVWHHGDLNRDFWDVYYDYENNPKYVQFPTIELLNEEFAIIQEESQVKQEQPEVNEDFFFDEVLKVYDNNNKYPPMNEDKLTMLETIARHFYELGLNARKEE